MGKLTKAYSRVPNKTSWDDPGRLLDESGTYESQFANWLFYLLSSNISIICHNAKVVQFLDILKVIIAIEDILGVFYQLPCILMYFHRKCCF